MKRLSRGLVVLAVAVGFLSCSGDPTGDFRQPSGIVASPTTVFINVGDTKPVVASLQDDQGNQIGVSFTLLEAGNAIWCQFTTANQGRPGPISLDERVITTPTIQSPICGGTTIITVGPANAVNEVERTNLYNTLRFGALPDTTKPARNDRLASPSRTRTRDDRLTSRLAESTVTVRVVSAAENASLPV